MSRTHLLGAASAVALSFASTIAVAQVQPTSIQGGGSTLAAADYYKEFSTYNASGPVAPFNNPDATAAAGNNQANDALYWPSGSGTGQSAFLTDNLNADCLKVVPGDADCMSTTPGGVNTVDYGASDATFSTTQIAQWASSSLGQSAAGNLIQLPSMGVGISFPVVHQGVTANGATTAHRAVAGGLVLTDTDLCGIFSGSITNWNATSAFTTSSKPAAGQTNIPGAFTVVYRSDGSGTSFLLLNHLAAVCNSTNSAFPNATASSSGITPSTTFTSVFTNNATGVTTVPSNFLGESGSGGVANTLSNYNTMVPTLTNAIGYLSPDYTTVDPNSDARLVNLSGTSVKSTLVVAAVKNGTLPYVPYLADVTNALNHVKQGQNTKAPATAAQGANPTAFVPLIQLVSLGYPVVGYTTFDFAQCYQNAAVQTSLLNYLSLHYSTNATYNAIIHNNGFVAISSSGAKAFVGAITGGILSNTKKWNDNIGNTGVCKSVGGTKYIGR